MRVICQVERGDKALINKNSTDPIYVQIKKAIILRIEEGVYKSGDKIPSERSFSEEFGASRMTVRQAINELVNEEKLYREQGRGTFIASPKFLQHNLKSFTQTLIERGHNPTTEILEFTTVFNLKEISKMLDISTDSVLYKLKRLRMADGIPVALETVYIPKLYCQGLEKHDISGSLYGVLEQEYGYTIDTISCEIDACISDKFQMKLFKVPTRVPLLKVSGINCTADKQKLFYETSYYRSDLYKYQVDLYRRQWK